MSIFEGLMFVCFGIGWPISIIKTIRSKSVAGKSVLFLFVIFSGYVFAIIHKLVNGVDWVIILSSLNGLMVLTDLILTLWKMENSPLKKLFGKANA